MPWVCKSCYLIKTFSKHRTPEMVSYISYKAVFYAFALSNNKSKELYLISWFFNINKLCCSMFLCCLVIPCVASFVRKLKSQLFYFVSPILQVNTLTLFSLAAFVVLCWPCQTDAVYFGCTTQLLLFLSQRKVSAVVIVALITVGVAC